MSEENEKTENPINWKDLDDVLRRWAALTGHENDQSWYQKMKEQYE